MFSSRLGGSVLAQGEGFLATRREDGTYALLLFNPRRFGSVYRQRDEGDYRAGDLAYIFQDDCSVTFRIRFDRLPAGTWDIFIARVPSDRGNPLSEWQKLGFRTALHAPEYDYLRAATVPREEYLSEKVSDGVLQTKVTLPANEFALVVIRQEEPLQ